MSAHAQTLTKKDSLRILRDTAEMYILSTYHLYVLGEEKLNKRDSSLKNAHLYYQALEAFHYPASDNPGRPVYPIFFRPDSSIGFSLGKENLAYYRYNGRNVRLFKTLRP